MRIELTSVFVDDQRAALAFYTDVLGFERNMTYLSAMMPGLHSCHRTRPMVPNCSSSQPGHPAVQPYRDALVADGIPMLQFAVDDVEHEHRRLTAHGVKFTQPPTDIGAAVVAIFDDTAAT